MLFNMAVAKSIQLTHDQSIVHDEYAQLSYSSWLVVMSKILSMLGIGKRIAEKRKSHGGRLTELSVTKLKYYGALLKVRWTSCPQPHPFCLHLLVTDIAISLAIVAPPLNAFLLSWQSTHICIM